MDLNFNLSLLDMELLHRSLPSSGKIVIAVSGGSDSMALLCLLQSYVSRCNKNLTLYAVTVDHKLRPESALEAQFVARFCKKHNIIHQTLEWVDQKPKTGIYVAGRLARYKLLKAFARSIGASAVLTGHTLNDQMETCEMRLKRGAGRGLACMSPLVYFTDDLLLLRPLLAASRDELRESLLLNNITWLEDPTNKNLQFERVRVRDKLLHDRARLAYLEELVNSSIVERQDSNKTIVNWLQSPNWGGYEAGILKINLNWLKNHINHKEIYWFLNIWITLLGGKEYFLGRKDVERLKLELGRILASVNAVSKESAVRISRQRFTLGLVVLETKANYIVLYRENRNLPQCLLPSGSELLWDGRYWLKNKTKDDLLVKAPNLAEIKQLLKEQERLVNAYKANQLIGLPIICTADNSKLLYHMLDDVSYLRSTLEIKRVLYPFYFSVSSYDWELFKALSRLVAI